MQFKENQTIYLQIAERISDEILLGHYAIGSRIPSVREYAALVEVNANTAMRSYEFLQTQGITTFLHTDIYTQHFYGRN